MDSIGIFRKCFGRLFGSFGPKSKEFEKLPSKLLAAQSDVDQNSEKKFREILGTLSTLPKGIPQSFQTFGQNVDRASSNNQLDGQSELQFWRPQIWVQSSAFTNDIFNRVLWSGLGSLLSLFWSSQQLRIHHFCLETKPTNQIRPSILLRTSSVQN